MNIINLFYRFQIQSVCLCLCAYFIMQQLHNYIFQRALLSIFTKIAFFSFEKGTVCRGRGGRRQVCQMRGGSLKTFVYLFITNLLRFPSTAVSFQCVFTKSSGVGAVQKIFSLLLKFFAFFFTSAKFAGGANGGGRGIYLFTQQISSGWRVVVIW